MLPPGPAPSRPDAQEAPGPGQDQVEQAEPVLEVSGCQLTPLCSVSRGRPSVALSLCPREGGGLRRGRPEAPARTG